jgi:hypothetical protein
MRIIRQKLFAVAMAGLLPAGAALAHEDAAIPNDWASTPGNSMLAWGPAQAPSAPNATPRHHRSVDKCGTAQGELYLKCRA